MFSILMANYNADKYIQEAIKSVLNQTFKEWKLLIIDDASTDNSLIIIEQFLDDNRIKLIKNKNNIGYGASLNKLANYIDSPFFGTLDADDKLANNAIEVMYNAHLQYPNASMIYSQFMTCDNKMVKIKKGYCDYIPENKTNLEVNKVSHFRTHKLKYYNLTDGFHTKLKSAIDKDISYKMEEVGNLVFIDEVLYYHRKNSEGISQRKNRKTAKQNMKIAKQEARERRRK